MRNRSVCCVTVCVVLSLVLVVCLASAYFSKEERELTCDRMDRGGEGKDCDMSSAEANPPVGGVASQEEEKRGQPEEESSSHGLSSAETNLPAGGDANKEEGKRGQPEEFVSLLREKEEFYVASMVLSGVGDALGYRKGRWEFNTDGPSIHEELNRLGGLERLHLEAKGWPVSDDTVMHLATAEALVEFRNETDKKELYGIIAKKYIECMNDMSGRAPGPTSMSGAEYLKSHKTYKLPFDSRGGGCGGAMRAMCIGLRYPREEDLEELIAVSIESGRMTHHNPTGYLGALTSALFTSYSIQRRSIISWGRELMKNVLPKAKKYIESQGRFVKENLEAWSYFEKKWDGYLRERQLKSGNSEPVFPPNFDVKARDKFYQSLSFSGWGGASGHDAPMIAYDALLGSRDSWSELCLRGMLHGGDSDSTGTIAAAWFGALYGFKGVPEGHHKHLEYRGRLVDCGKEIYRLASAESSGGHREKEPSHAKEVESTSAESPGVHQGKKPSHAKHVKKSTPV